MFVCNEACDLLSSWRDWVEQRGPNTGTCIVIFVCGLFWTNRSVFTKGHLEVELNFLGRNEAKLAGQRIRDMIGDASFQIVSSDSSRARETAQIIAAELPKPPEIRLLPLLRERSSGIHEGKLWSELADLLPNYSSLETPKFITVLDEFTIEWVPYVYIFDKLVVKNIFSTRTGESKAAFLDRCVLLGSELKSMLEKEDSADVLCVVSHGLTLRVLFSLLCFSRDRSDNWKERHGF